MGHTLPPVPDAGHQACLDRELYGEVLGADISLEYPVESSPCIHDFKYGSLLYRADASVDAVYHIRSGIVKMVRFEPTGGQRIVRVLKAGDVAEIESIISDVFEHTAIAVDNVSACRIPIESFRRHVVSSGQVQWQALKQSLANLREAETWLSQLTGNKTSARARMARLLLCLRVGADERIHRIGIEDMAAIVGITAATVSRIVSEFRRNGMISDGGNRASAQRYFRGNVAALEQIAREMSKGECGK